MNHTTGHATARGNQVHTSEGTLALTMAAGMEQRIADAKRIALCLNMHDILLAELKEAAVSLSRSDYLRVIHLIIEIEDAK